MSTALETAREVMAQYLTEHGVQAVTAWRKEEREHLSQCVAVVSLRKCQVSPGGFQDYLGERFREETGRWEEQYGRQAVLTFGLDLYAPESAGGEKLQEALDMMTAALLAGGPEGGPVQEFSCGEIVFDREARLLKLPVQAVCRTFLCAAAQQSGAFTEFELRGGMKS